MLAGSPWPRWTRKLDVMVVPLKKASSTFGLSKPDIGPVSRPSARGQDQVGALQAAVAERRLAASVARAVEPGLGIGMREQVGQLLVEILVEADDHRHRRGHGLVVVAFRQGRFEPGDRKSVV